MGCIMLNCLAVGAGGAPGAILRCLIGFLPVKMQSGFPIKTFLINIAGSFLIGIAAALAAKRGLGPRAVLFSGSASAAALRRFPPLPLRPRIF